MVPFYKNELGFRIELKTSSSFKTTGLLQPWQTLCKIFCKCLKTRVTRWDQPPLQIMQMMYCFINNIHVDYADLLWRVRDRYHNLKDNDIMKNIFNSGRHKDRVGMKIPDWMISEEMKHTEHYWMYAEVFGIDVPLTQSQPTESTQGTHRTPSAPRRSTRLTPPAPVPPIDKADEMILQDTLQVSLTEHKSREEQEARENVKLVNEHLTSIEIEKMSPGVIRKVRRWRLLMMKREKGKIVEESRSIPFPTPIRSLRIHTDLVSSDTQKLQELTAVMVESLPTMVDKHIKEQVKTQVPKQVKVQVPVYVVKGLLLERQQNKEETDKMIAKAML
ncbi:hypothetical protein Tco_1359926 [Tanacetum coccineum]